MRSTTTAILLLLLVGLLPLVSDAGPGEARCCNAASSLTQDLFPGGSGDEDFFTVPGGPPNVMLVLDNSGSMLNLPALPNWSSLPDGGAGTCSFAPWADYAVLQRTNTTTVESAFNFSTGSGNNVNGSSSNPAWVTGNCGTANNQTGCLFDPARYYVWSPQSDEPDPRSGPSGTLPWTARSATSTTTPCANVPSSYQAACSACLSTSGSGYYLWKNGDRNYVAFSGRFLNVYPPKIILARKVLKDLLSINPLNPSTVDSVRFGLTVFSSSSSSLKVPLVPACSDAIGQLDNATFVKGRKSIIDFLDGLDIQSSQTTPLANTLFNVARYFSDAADGSGSLWATRFPGATTGGTDLFAYNTVDPNHTSVANSSICWKCQQSSIVLITDGAPYNDNALPSSSCAGSHTGLFDCGSGGTGDFLRWAGGTVDGSKKLSIDCATSACGTDLGNGSANKLHLVAAYLRYWDQRPNPASGSSPVRGQLDGDQNVSTFTIGLNLIDGSVTANLLEKTATLGGGAYVNATNSDELSGAVANAVNTVITMPTSFTVSNTNALQAASAAQLFTARFRPLNQLTWEGHLFRFTLFNELALGCDPKKAHNAQTSVPASAGACAGKNPNLDGRTVNGLADCDSFYIVDQDCDAVIEDPDTGAFMKAAFVSGVMTQTTTPAVPYWDGGKVLSTPGTTAYRSADEAARNKRKIYTLLDTDGDGRFGPGDNPLVEFTVANVSRIMPYLSLDAAWCASLYQRLNYPVPAAWATADYENCAKQVIWFIRGWDVMDEDQDGCAGPGGLGAFGNQAPRACTADSDCSPGTAGMCNAVSRTCTCASGALGEERDAPNGLWKLGDIFHSSPQPVDPPYNEVLCDIGRGQTQCVATLHSPSALSARTVQTAIAVDSVTGYDAYEQYRRANADRPRVVLAGGNDGMLHAFDGGSPDTSAALDVFGSRPFTVGSGAELWAFVPPDMLPKLHFALDGHQYFVDGDIMVRDIWNDDDRDRTKTSGEFRTLAVFSERSGGTQFVALDVTDPQNPSFRWSWPPLCSVEQNLVGQSWTDFSPRPPPIGPVRLLLPGNTGTNPKARTDALGRNFEERWIVMVNGGYDPTATRGRGVWMLDAWTGDVVWRYTDAQFQAILPSNASAGMFPVPAAVGLVDIGSANAATLDSDGFFDTATWGDMGGELWVARFQEPGDISTGEVTNWTAARAFEEMKDPSGRDNQAFWMTLPDGTTQFRNEFYRMTANIWEPTTSTLRTYLGSGNRDKLLNVQPGCGPSNFLGCSQNNCNVVDLKNTTSYGSCDITTTYQNNNGNFQHVNVTVGNGCGTGALTCGSGVKTSIQMHLNGCYRQNPSDAIAGQVCDANGVCSSRIKITKSRDLSTVGWPMTSHNRFYGVSAYSADRSFDGATGTAARALATTFDANRYTDQFSTASTTARCWGGSCLLVDTTKANVSSTGTVTCDGGGTACQATTSDPGWYYEYGRKCPTGDCTGQSLPWTDEKTGSGATVIGACVDWNTIRPMGMAITGTPCSGGAGKPANLTYLANSITGVPDNRFCGFPASNLVYRATQRRSIAPPLDPNPVVSVSSTGVVRQSVLQIEPGNLQSKDLAMSSDVLRPIYWLEVPRDLHVCRHQDGTLCK